MNLRAYKDWIYFAFALLAGLWFISLSAVHYELHFFPGDLADARFNNYLLEHAWLFFSGEENSFWSAGFMYPEANVISYSDNLLGTAPFYSAFRLLGADRETSFQLWYLLLCVLNYTTCYLFLRFLIKQPMAAALGAMIFAFSIALNSQIVHAQTFARFMMPLAFWAALLFHRDLKPRYFFLTLLAWVYQMYCGIYLGFLLLAPLLMLFLIGFIKRFGLYRLKFRDLRWWGMMAGALVLSMAILLPLMLPYLERAKQTGFYPYEQVIQTLPTPMSYLYSRHASLLWDFLKDTCVSYPNFWDFQIFPGGLALLSAVVLCLGILWRTFKISRLNFFKLDQHMQLLMWTALLCVVFFLRLGHFSLYRILYELPGYGSMRALQRIINLELVFFAAAFAYLMSIVFKRAGKSAWMVFVLAALLTIADNRIHPDSVDKELKIVAQDRVNVLMKKINTADPNTVLSYEPDTLVPRQIFFQLDGMMAAQSLGIPTLNGYSATAPFGYDAYWRQSNETTRRIWLKQVGLTEEHIQIVK